MKIESTLESYLICFTTGFAVLVLELDAFRLFAPHFGVSTHVTGIIINVILLALAAGYWLGGWFADKYHDMRLEYWVILTAAMLLLVVYASYTWLLPYFTTLSLLVGATLAASLFFFIPMVLLAFIPPYLVKALAKQGQVGEAAGKIYSIGTFGSITGGVLTTFLFIPQLGSRWTLMLAIVLLFLLSVAGLFRKSRAMVFVIMLPLIVMFLPAHATDEFLVTESEYNVITVKKDKDIYYLKLNDNYGYHSRSLDPKTGLTHSYYDEFLYAQLFFGRKSRNNGFRTLILGNGAGTAMMQLQRFFPQEVTGIEIDPELTRIGEEYFGLHLGKRDKILHEDARTFVNRNEQKFDVIIIDLYAGGPYIPFHVTTREFYRHVRHSLTPYGVIAINVPSYAKGTELSRRTLATIMETFPSAYLGGRILFAFQTPTEKADLKARIKASPYSNADNLRVVDKLTQLDPVTYSSDIFTDDQAPVEQLVYLALKHSKGFTESR
ncbi:MAG: hypothetical protein D6698_05375 [Gammaproteobacteria bacterium]|nr:MAG: hypothetical protein D6698_05375 [Gammaproteobacteria bacterium]